MEDRCICCGAVVPEGRMVCPSCEKPKCTHNRITIKPDGMHDLSPHRFKLDKRLRNVTVEILRCEVCGEVSIGWYRQEDTEDVC